MEQAKGAARTAASLAAPAIKTGTDLVRGSVTWDSKAEPQTRGFAYWLHQGQVPIRSWSATCSRRLHGSGKTRFCPIPTIDLLTYGDWANGSGAGLHRRHGREKTSSSRSPGPKLSGAATIKLLLDTQNPYQATVNPINLVVKTRRER